MKNSEFRTRFTGKTAAAALLLAVALPIHAATPRSVDVFVTNRVSRVITNLVEIRMPMNVFRDEFKTNWIQQFQTNYIDVFRTNVIEKAQTNTSVINLTRTNWIQAFHTNLNTVSLTNWETVVVLKTNWMTQSLTNTIEISMPSKSPESTPAAAPVKPDNRPRRHLIGQAQGLIIEMSRTSKAPANDQVEVELAVRATDATGTLQVLEWQLSRSDGTVMLFGERDQFKAELPAGSYKVMVKVRRNDKPQQIRVMGAAEISSTGDIHRTALLAQNAQ